MVSYWKLVDMKTAKVIAIGVREKPLIDLKLHCENKLHMKTKMLKCFGQFSYDKSVLYMMRKATRTMYKISKHKYYMYLC